MNGATSKLRERHRIRRALYAAAIFWSAAPASAVAQDARPVLAEPERSVSQERGSSDKPDNLWRWHPAALTDPLVTDRPDFTESVETIPRGHAQFESGYTFTLDSEEKPRTRSHTAPEALLRAGLADALELRVGWEGYSWVSERAAGLSRAGRHVWFSDWSDAAADLSLGLKHGLGVQEGWRPALGVIGAVSVPSGNVPASSGDVDPEAKLLWASELSDTLSLAGNANLALPSDEGRRFVQTSASISLGITLTEQLGLYTEYFGFYPAERGADCAHTANGGLSWKLTDNLQFDWRAGFGLNEQADDFFTGVGFAIRF